MLSRSSLSLLIVFTLCANITDSYAAAHEKKKKRQDHLVEIVNVKEISSGLSSKWYGSLQYNELVNIYNQEKGRIDTFPYKEGDRVKKGALLVGMDDRLLKAEKVRLLAQIAQAKMDQNRIQSLVKKQAISRGELDQANTQLAVLGAERNLLDIRLGYFKIRAPFSGIITERFANKGDAVSEQEHLLTLSNFNSLVAKVQVSESALASLTLGMAAAIIIPSTGARFAAKVSRIYPKLHPTTRQATVEITFNKIPEKLFSGQSVLAEISGEQKSRILIPLAALKRDSDGEHVFLLKNIVKNAINESGNIKDNDKANDKISNEGKSKAQIQLKAHRQAVISSNYIAGKVEITQGIKADDKIITRGFLGLNEGKIVKVSAIDNIPITRKETNIKPAQETAKEAKTTIKPANSLTDKLKSIWSNILETMKS